MILRSGVLAVLLTLLAACGQDEVAVEAAPVVTGDAALHLAVTGMTCGGCANRLEFEMGQVPGVVSCEVAFIDRETPGEAVISYRSQAIDADTLVQRFNAIGHYRGESRSAAVESDAP